MFASVNNFWTDPAAGLHGSVLDWFLFFGLFVVSLMLWGLIIAEVRDAL